MHAGGGHAGADSTVKMTTPEAALLGPQKDTTTLWAAATFMFLEMPLNATAAHILVAAAAFGGPHAKSWPALPLHLQGDRPLASRGGRQSKNVRDARGGV